MARLLKEKGCFSGSSLVVRMPLHFCNTFSKIYELNGWKVTRCRAIHLSHSGLRMWQKLARFYWYAAELLALCYCLCWFQLVGWPKPIWHKLTIIWSSYCYNVKRLWVRVHVHFFIWMFNLGIPYGAKVGLKLRLCLGFGVSFFASGFGQRHFVIGVLSRDPFGLVTPTQSIRSNDHTFSMVLLYQLTSFILSCFL